MKKLLSILTISTLTASVPAPLLATAPLTRVKRDVWSSEKEEKEKDNILLINNEKNKNDIFFINKNNIFNEHTKKIFIDKKNEEILFFINFDQKNKYLKEIYFLDKNKEITLLVDKINNKGFSDFIKVNDKFYFGGNDGIYEFEKTNNKYIKIHTDNDGVYQFNVDNQNNIYYLTSNLKKIKRLKLNNKHDTINDTIFNSSNPIVYFLFDKNNNFYYANKLTIFKKNSNELNKSESKEVLTLQNNNNVDNNADIIKQIVIGDENNILTYLNSGKLFFMLDKINIEKILTFNVDNQNNIYYLDFFNKNIYKISRLNTNENIFINNKNNILIIVASTILGFILFGTLLSLYIIYLKKKKKTYFY